MSPSETVKRFSVMLIGLIVTALGLAICVRADLGISPITTFPYALNRAFPALTLGTYVFLQHTLFFLLTVALLRRDLKPFQLLLLPCSFLFGWCVDLWELALSGLRVEWYPARIVLLLLGCTVVGFGFGLVNTSRVSLEANTAFLNALSLRTGKPYASLKVATDVIFVLAAAAVGLVCLGTVVGIREGTIIALVIGPITGFFNRRLAGMERFFTKTDKPK